MLGLIFLVLTQHLNWSKGLCNNKMYAPFHFKDRLKELSILVALAHNFSDSATRIAIAREADFVSRRAVVSSTDLL